MPYSVAIAGSTHHTQMCLEALAKDERFNIPWVLTPGPKPIGRKQVVTKNPVHAYAEEHKISSFLIDKKIDDELHSQITNQVKPDFLLVVDFGYLVPKWLLDRPSHYPLNIHPSTLPRWRGSSPGQFALLYGETKSSVTFMVMDEELDSGPIIHQLPFSVQPDWTQKEYYLHSFTEITKILGDLIEKLAIKQLSPTPQPTDSPTPIARRLTKEDGYVSWEALQSAMDGKPATSVMPPSSTLLTETVETLKSWPQVIANATRALSPWPMLWTIIPTAEGQKRMQVLSATLENGKLELQKVKIEGQTEAGWNQVKNQVVLP